MTDKRIRLTYRLPKALYEKIAESAKKKEISVNAEINYILSEYFKNKG